ncbi:MAG: hypothetical protein JWP63_6623 [Candidatus Solibacter sp.]|nr:hypothetical protein [Candidatus Solibacter sp.]
MRMPSQPYISIVVPPGKLQLPTLGDDVEVIVTESRNAGIRQARGEFILNTSGDLEFSAELIEFLISRRLEKGRLYRIDLREGNVLHAREGSFPLTAGGLRANAVEDVAGVDSGVHFGDGWFPPERDPKSGEIFRWIGNDAEVVVHGEGALAIEVEPGPGVGPLPQILQVLDEAGAKVAGWSVAGRASLQLWMPPGTRRFRLVAADGGRAVLNDLRLLNFRVFRCDWVRFSKPVSRQESLRPVLMRLVRSGALGSVPGAMRLLRSVGPDVFGAGIDYWGTGWHRLEETFRWASTDAELVVRIDGVQQDLCMLIEPGPSLKGQAFNIAVRFADGAVIGKARVSGLTLVRVPLPIASGNVAALLLSPDRQGEALRGDSRVLNFRVLACACEPSKRPALAMKVAGWTAVTIGQRPAEIEWLQSRESLEIGKPAFLHTNACEFLLMDRDLWFDLRGLPENYALFCYSAHFAGAVEEVLPLPLQRTGSPPVRAKLDADLIWLITQMRRLRTPAILTMDTWGMK